MVDLLRERDAGHIHIFGGGGGTILPREISQLHEYGVTRIYSPNDGREMGLQGMINDLLQQCDTPISPCPEATSAPDLSGVAKKLSSAQGNLARKIGRASCRERVCQYV